MLAKDPPGVSYGPDRVWVVSGLRRPLQREDTEVGAGITLKNSRRPQEGPGLLTPLTTKIPVLPFCAVTDDVTVTVTLLSTAAMP